MKISRRFRIIIGVYGVLWALAVITFWFFYKDSQRAMFHVIVVRYGLLPVLTFILSILIGKEYIPARYVWLVPICFSIAYLGYVLLTLSLGLYVLAGNVSLPEIPDFLFCLIISAIGLLIGIVLRKILKFISNS